MTAAISPSGTRAGGSPMSLDLTQRLQILLRQRPRILEPADRLELARVRRHQPGARAHRPIEGDDLAEQPLLLGQPMSPEIGEVAVMDRDLGEWRRLDVVERGPQRVEGLAVAACRQAMDVGAVQG